MGAKTMDELIVMELRGKASREQEEELARWRSADEHHERRYRELKELWAWSETHPEIGPDEPAPSVADLLSVGRRAHARWRPAGGARWASAAAAAAFLLGFVVGHALRGPAFSGIAGEAEFRTGPGQVATATLGDGSVVRLAPSSRLRVTRASDSREVWLDGQAFFSVAPDPDRPFRVQTAGGEARVLGTRFDLTSAGDSLRLLVLEGRVSVLRPEGETEVAAGKLAAAQGEAPLSVVEVEDPESLVRWMGLFMAFESTPLRQVARELELRLGLQVEITDPALETRTVTGWFAEEVKDDLVAIICRIADVGCTIDDDLVRIHP